MLDEDTKMKGDMIVDKSCKFLVPFMLLLKENKYHQ